jgi:hypothetical protein
MSASITTDVSNYEVLGQGDLSHTMKALTWQGKNTVKVGQSFCVSGPSLHFDHLKK